MLWICLKNTNYHGPLLWRQANELMHSLQKVLMSNRTIKVKEADAQRSSNKHLKEKGFCYTKSSIEKRLVLRLGITCELIKKLSHSSRVFERPWGLGNRIKKHKGTELLVDWKCEGSTKTSLEKNSHHSWVRIFSSCSKHT